MKKVLFLFLMSIIPHFIDACEYEVSPEIGVLNGQMEIIKKQAEQYNDMCDQERIDLYRSCASSFVVGFIAPLLALFTGKSKVGMGTIMAHVVLMRPEQYDWYYWVSRSTSILFGAAISYLCFRKKLDTLILQDYENGYL